MLSSAAQLGLNKPLNVASTSGSVDKKSGAAGAANGTGSSASSSPSVVASRAPPPSPSHDTPSSHQGAGLDPPLGAGSGPKPSSTASTTSGTKQPLPVVQPRLFIDAISLPVISSVMPLTAPTGSNVATNHQRGFTPLSTLTSIQAQDPWNGAPRQYDPDFGAQRFIEDDDEQENVSSDDERADQRDDDSSEDPNDWINSDTHTASVDAPVIHQPVRPSPAPFVAAAGVSVARAAPQPVQASIARVASVAREAGSEDAKVAQTDPPTKYETQVTKFVEETMLTRDICKMVMSYLLPFQGHVGQVLKGHRMAVTHIIVMGVVQDENGVFTERVLTASSDCSLKVWDLGMGIPVQSFEQDLIPTSVALMPTGEVVVSFGYTFGLHDPVSGRTLHTIHAQGLVRCLQPLEHGLVCVTQGSDINIWHMRSGVCQQRLQSHTKDVTCLIVTPNGRLVSGSADRTIKVWDLEKGACTLTLVGAVGRIHALVTLDDETLLSGGADSDILVWSLSTGQLVRRLAGHDCWVHKMALLPGGNLASASFDETIKIWDIDSGEVLRSWSGNKAVRSLTLLPSGRLAVGHWSGDVTILT